MNIRKACLYIIDDHHGTKNYPFRSEAEGIGFKNLLYSFVYLKRILGAVGIDLSTRDINSPEESFLTLCWDNPHTLVADKREGQIWCLLINDPPAWAPESWDKKYHDKFDYIFTFDETLVDNVKYFYYPFAIDTEYFSIPGIVSESDFEHRRLATFVSNAIHKYPDPNQPNSTLHKRYETIEWYGKYHPEDFRFYGGTFVDRDYYFGFRGIRLFRKFLPAKFITALAKSKQKNLIKVYGGRLGPLEKFDVIRRYRFYYCYENTVGINGYICEKIFDCLYSGIVPIYWGAPNVKELIPYDCFIDGENFQNQESLYKFLKSMSYATYSRYLQEARIFLSSPEMERFTVKNSIECVLSPLRGSVEGLPESTMEHKISA